MVDRILKLNLAPQSNTMAISPWTSANLDLTQNQSDPFGNNNSTLLVEQADGGSSNHYLGFAGTILPPYGVPMLASFYIYPISRTFAGFRAGIGALTVFMNLTTFSSTVSSGNLLGSGVEDIGSGWYRVWFIYNSYGTNDSLRFYTCNTTSLIYKGTLGTQACKMFGAQVENLLYGQTSPNPYISTTAAGGSGPKEYRQNLLSWSENLSNSIWSKNLFGIWNSCTVSENFDTAPNGTLTADKITSPITGSYGIMQRISVLPSTTYTFSGWIKNIDATNLNILIYTYNNNTVVRSQSISFSYGLIWSKFSASITVPASGENSIAFGIGLNATDSLKSFILWGLQVVQGNLIGDYIKSTISQVNANGATRNLII